jgi:class 3 adenylate cyclase
MWSLNDASNVGIVWYRAWVEVPKGGDSDPWAISIADVYAAMEMFCDGNIILSHGKVGNSKDLEFPGFMDHLYVIQDGSLPEGQHLITMRVSNHHWPSGGLSRTPTLAASGVLIEQQGRENAWEAFIIGLFFLSGVYHLILFLSRRAQRDYLIFALLSLVAALFFVDVDFTDLIISNKDFPGLNTRLYWILSMSAGILLYWFLSVVFDYRKRSLSYLVVGGSILTGVTAFVPVDLTVLGDFMFFVNYWFQFTLLVGIYIVFWALLKKKPGSRVLATGVVAAALGSFYAVGAIEADFWAKTGVAMLVVSMAISLSNKMTAMENDVRRTLDVFRLLVPEPTLDRIAKEGIDNIKLGGAEEGMATILFTDIRSFTSVAENLSPSATLGFLNTFMQRMQPVIQVNGGFINQFVGDEVMAIFYKTGHAAASIRSAIAIRKDLRKQNIEHMERGEPPIDVGIGINTGKVIWGTIGSEVRMESAVVGDTVNVASRIQHLTKTYGVGALVSETTIQGIQDPEEYFYREVGVVQVRGKTKPVVIYELFDRDEEYLKTQKIQCLSEYNQGLVYFHANEWRTALPLFEKCLQICPDDPISRIYFERCKARLEHSRGRQ